MFSIGEVTHLPSESQCHIEPSLLRKPDIFLSSWRGSCQSWTLVIQSLSLRVSYDYYIHNLDFYLWTTALLPKFLSLSYNWSWNGTRRSPIAMSELNVIKVTLMELKNSAHQFFQAILDVHFSLVHIRRDWGQIFFDRPLILLPETFY